MVRKTLHLIIRFILFVVCRTDIYGKENMPAQSPGLVATNHLGTLDAALVFAVFDRTDITAMVAKKHQKSALWRFLFNAVGGIWLNRDEADTQAIRHALEHLEKGGLLGIAPEGTRSKTGGMIPAKTGVAYLASRANVPIFPAAITGTYRAVWNVLKLKRPHIAIRFGEPFTLPPLDRKDRAASLQRNTDEIMCRIAVMLPPEYWGVYADHPRLKELLESKEAPVISSQPSAVKH